MVVTQWDCPPGQPCTADRLTAFHYWFVVVTFAIIDHFLPFFIGEAKQLLWLRDWLAARFVYIFPRHSKVSARNNQQRYTPPIYSGPPFPSSTLPQYMVAHLFPHASLSIQPYHFPSPLTHSQPALHPFHSSHISHSLLPRALTRRL